MCVQGQHQPGKSCPQCRTPISGLFRYGRSLKKRAIDMAQRTFLQDSEGRLRKAEEVLSTAEAALIDWNGAATEVYPSAPSCTPAFVLRGLDLYIKHMVGLKVHAEVQWHMQRTYKHVTFLRLKGA